jgi:hypothetical protein
VAKRESQVIHLFVSPIAFPNILLIVAQTLEYFLDGGLKTLSSIRRSILAVRDLQFLLSWLYLQGSCYRDSDQSF